MTTEPPKWQFSIAGLLGLMAVIAITILALRLAFAEESTLVFPALFLTGGTWGGVIGFLRSGWKGIPPGFVWGVFAAPVGGWLFCLLMILAIYAWR